MLTFTFWWRWVFILFYLTLFTLNFLILEREGNINLLFHLCTLWLILACVLNGDRTCDLGSNQLSFLAKASEVVFLN